MTQNKSNIYKSTWNISNRYMLVWKHGEYGNYGNYKYSLLIITVGYVLRSEYNIKTMDIIPKQDNRTQKNND